MTSLLEAVRGIVDPKRVVAAPVLLAEEAKDNKCEPIQVRYAGESWALRLRDGDCLPVLAELPHARSLRRLPDYLVFSEPRVPPQRPDDVALQVLVCEMKSSATGAEEALPQVQLGRLFAQYLIRLAVHDLGEAAEPKLYCCGMIASRELPAGMVAKGRTRPGKVEPPWSYDKRSQMRMYLVRSGEEIRLESLY